MELMDTFAKYDVQLDQSCKKNEKMYFDVCNELKIGKAELWIELSRDKQMSVEQYIQNFKWDQNKFGTDKSLKLLGAAIMGKQRTADEKLKKLMDE